MPLTRIKVGVEVGFTKKKNRDEANRRSRNINISKRSFCFISLEMLNSSISSISKTEKCLLIQELMS
jgi:hypothetical protein